VPQATGFQKIDSRTRGKHSSPCPAAISLLAVPTLRAVAAQMVFQSDGIVAGCGGGVMAEFSAEKMIRRLSYRSYPSPALAFLRVVPAGKSRAFFPWSAHVVNSTFPKPRDQW